MNEEQIPKLLGVLVENQRFFKRLSTESAQWVIQNPYEAIKLAVKGIENHLKIEAAKVAETKDAPKLLRQLGSVVIHATAEKFSPKVSFIKDTSKKAKAKISRIGDNFEAWFLTGEGTVEEAKAKTYISYYKLLKPSADGPIIAELGGEAIAESVLSEIYALIAMQLNCDDGALKTIGCANIFYVRDVNGVLRSVGLYLEDDGWSVDAFPFEEGNDWGEGDHVFVNGSSTFMYKAHAGF
jgi:hypothetical protein